MRQRDENKIEAIRDRAIEIIVKEGFDGLSMKKLADAANVSPATIYIYHKNREDLLNNLFNEVQATFNRETLKGFDPDAPFAEGLWIQWQNRYRFMQEHPLYITFLEQFRNSPLINHDAITINEFKKQMKRFVMNAIQRGEIIRTEPEVFWAIAYGSFYALMKFNLHQKSMMSKNFKLTEEMLRTAFNGVIKALTP
jgi:TetR/AcrR family transcriptional regulator, multidrug resistance operon repressor